METTSDSPPSPPNKRLKTLTESPIPSPSYSKGKSKIEFSPDEDAIANESTDCCGICFSEAVIGAVGVSRGFIDSCNHYFCFVCIMEWAKVESKCPLCKRRFSSIRRPAKPPVFPSERVVRIPVRDQIYNGIGNATLGPPDPYSEVTCNVCHSVANENLLLLCDLCDTASHTYCIGLGHTVPEGDWFCQDCTLLKDESLTSDINTEPTFQVRLQKDHALSSADQNISISDIVREPYTNAYQRTRSASSYPSPLPPSSATNAETSTSNINTENSRIGRSDTRHPTNSTARTLRRCHYVHGRIHVLRQKWNDYQNGTLGFSSGRPDIIISSQSVSSVSRQNQASRSNEQSTAQCSSSNNVTHGTREDEVLKAWKMLDRAKLMKKSLGKSQIVNQSAKYPARELNATKGANDLSNRLRHPNSQKLEPKNGCNGGPEKLYSRPLTMEYRSQKSSVCGKREYESPTNKTTNNSYKGSVPVYMRAQVQPAAIKSVQIPTYQCNASILSGKKSPSAKKCSKGPVCLTISSVVPEPTKGQCKDVSSSSKEKHPKEKNQLDRTCAARSKQYYNARSEILSLVKLNLKFLTKDEKLDVDAYKEVARLATHSILAACGFEKPKPGYSSIPGSVCSHPRQPHTTSLMPDSCRECFYEFTKNMVVNTITLWKKRTVSY